MLPVMSLSPSLSRNPYAACLHEIVNIRNMSVTSFKKHLKEINFYDYYFLPNKSECSAKNVIRNES